MAHHLEIRVFKGRLVIGAVTDFPGQVLAAPTHMQLRQALAELRGHAEAVATLRRWPRTAELFPGSRGASDSQLCRLVEQAVERRRAVVLLVNDIHPVAHGLQGDGYGGWGAGAPGLQLQEQLASEQADAAIAAMSPRERVILALGESVNHMSGALKEYMSDLIRHGALPMIGLYLAGLIAANVANPVVGGILDVAIVLFVGVTVGVQGAEALKVLAEAIAGAATARKREEIDASARTFADAIVALGGTVFLAWLLRRIGSSGGGGKTGELAAVEEVAPVRTSRPAPASAPPPKKILEPNLKPAPAPSPPPAKPTGPVKPLDVGNYRDLAARSVGDGMTPDHIPSFAAIRARVEQQLGRELTPAEARKLRNETTAMVIDSAMHRAESATYGGRNTAAQIAADAKDLGAAAERDMAVMRDALKEAGYSNEYIDKAFDQIHKANKAMGLY